MNINLEDKINKLWTGIVNKLEFKPSFHQVEIDITTYESKNIKTNYSLLISEISFFLFYDKDSKVTQNYKWENTEISSFFYEPSIIKSPKTISDRYNKGRIYNIDYNLSIELWSTDLLIQANKLQINGEEFELE